MELILFGQNTRFLLKITRFTLSLETFSLDLILAVTATWQLEIIKHGTFYSKEAFCSPMDKKVYFDDISVLILINYVLSIRNCLSPTLTCNWVHCLSVTGGVSGALWWGGWKPPRGAASKVHICSSCSGATQSSSRVEHPADMSNTAGLIVRTHC